MSHLSWIEINKDNLLHNLSLIRELVGSKVQIFPCLKSNAYGHGLEVLSRVLKEQRDINGVSVVSLEEAEQLRKHGWSKPIQLLGAFPLDQVSRVKELEVIPFIFNSQQLEALGKLNIPLQVTIKIDSGMTRHGFLEEDLEGVFKLLKNTPQLFVFSLATHFASADEVLEPEHFQYQQEQFNKLVALFLANLDNEVLIQAANSAATLIAPQTHGDLVRPGIAIYGIYPSGEVKDKIEAFGKLLKPVLSWKTRLVQIKKVAAGTKVGYGATYVAHKDITVGVLSVGYADGLNRKLSNKGFFLVQGHVCPVIGRVCMNITMIDISKVTNPKLEEEVVLIGNQVSVDKWAEWIGTIPYEVVTSLREGLPRIVK